MREELLIIADGKNRDSELIEAEFAKLIAFERRLSREERLERTARMNLAPDFVGKLSR